MSKSTHTPWHTGGRSNLVICREDGYAVADCKTYHGRIGVDEAKRNAQLIAAAPEMYELLTVVKVLMDNNCAHALTPNCETGKLIAELLGKIDGEIRS